ncbi:MAG: hypothetical protein AAGI90_01310 [Chlamydiota bacterium]
MRRLLAKNAPHIVFFSALEMGKFPISKAQIIANPDLDRRLASTHHQKRAK